MDFQQHAVCTLGRQQAPQNQLIVGFKSSEQLANFAIGKR